MHRGGRNPHVPWAAEAGVGRRCGCDNPSALAVPSSCHAISAACPVSHGRWPAARPGPRQRAMSPAAPPPERPLRAFAGLWLAYFATIGLFNPYAPLWFQALGMSTLAIGAIASLQSWTRLLAPYAWSWAADHSGARVALIRAGRRRLPAGRHWAGAGAASGRHPGRPCRLADGGADPGPGGAAVHQQRRHRAAGRGGAGATAHRPQRAGCHPLRPGAHVGVDRLHRGGAGGRRAAAAAGHRRLSVAGGGHQRHAAGGGQPPAHGA